MQFLSASEAKPSISGWTKDPRSRRKRRFSIPKDSGARIALVADIMSRFKGHGIVVTYADWGVWPSGERMHLFDRLRASYGETRPLIDTPVHVFGADEFDDAVSFVTLGVLFLWDVDVFGKEAVLFSHDEVGEASFDIGRSHE